MNHPLMEPLAKFTWRMVVPRPWPAQWVWAQENDAPAARAAIARNNTRAIVLVALQAIAVTPFTCVYVSAATHMARMPNVFPFNGNIRALRAIYAAEGIGGMFKGAQPLMWAHVLSAYTRVLRVRGLNPATGKWERYQRLSRLLRWGCSLLIHSLEATAYCMMIESTPDFAKPVSAFRRLWKEGSWMRGWVFSAMGHLADPDSVTRWRFVPWNAIRLRLMVDPESKLWSAITAYGWLTPLAGAKAYLWSLLPMFLVQLATLAVGAVVLQRLLGPWDLDVGEPALKRLYKREDAPLLPFVRHVHRLERDGKRKAKAEIKEAYEQHRKQEAVARKKTVHELAKLDIAALLAHGYASLDEQNAGSTKFRAVAYGKMGPTIKNNVSTEAWDSLVEDPDAECSQEMWDTFFGSDGVRREFRDDPSFKTFICEMLQAGGATQEAVLTSAQQAAGRGGGTMPPGGRGGALPPVGGAGGLPAPPAPSAPPSGTPKPS